MMGEQRIGEAVSWRELSSRIPPGHLLRQIDLQLDMRDMHRALVPLYSGRGHPSVAPEILIRMALIGRLYGIRSERRLCEEIRYNLAYRWFCRLPLDVNVPHHSTLSKNRYGRFRDAGVFRLLFEQTVRRCIAAGLVTQKDAAIDASFVAADASWQRKMRDGDMSAPQLARPVREWLAEQAKRPSPAVPRGKILEVSRTDPASAWSARNVRGRFGYAFNVLIDAPRGVIMDIEASPARFAAEVDAGRTMLARAGERFAYHPKRVAADTAYGSGAFLAFVKDRGAIPHIPVLERSEQTRGKFPREAFRYEREQNRYICPAGKVLAYRGADYGSDTLKYSARPVDCRACHLKNKCTGGRSRSVTHSEHEEVRHGFRIGRVARPEVKLL